MGFREFMLDFKHNKYKCKIKMKILLIKLVKTIIILLLLFQLIFLSSSICFLKLINSQNKFKINKLNNNI